MTGHTVEKIGGTSIANTQVVLENIFLNGRKDPERYNRIFVVSAYAGITDRLLEHKKTGKPGVYALFAESESEWAWSEALTKTGEAMLKINADIFANNADRQLADSFVTERIEGVRNCLTDLYRLCSYGHFRIDEHLSTVREMLCALGEAHSAHNTALLLRQNGISANFVDLTGWRDDRQLTMDERIREAFDGIDLENELPIVTGYAQRAGGLLEAYGRGYSEVTFSRLAVLTEAAEAIIHKEFHLSSADPKLVGTDRVRKIGRTNYDVADQLSNMGMEAIHPRAARGLRQSGIPLRVKNTFDTADQGTVICSDYVTPYPHAEIVTGLTGVVALELFEQDMVGVKGYDAAILEALTRHRVRIVSKNSNANTITHYVQAPLRQVKRVIADLEREFEGAQITARKLAIVSVIGSDLDIPDLLVRATGALAAANVAILGITQIVRKVDLQVLVAEDSFKDAVVALHDELVESEEPQVDEAPATGSSKTTGSADVKLEVAA